MSSVSDELEATLLSHSERQAMETGKDAILDHAEASLDAIDLAAAELLSPAAEEVFDAVPVLKYLVAMLKVARTYQGYSLMKKLIAMLREVDSVSSKDRQAVLNALGATGRSKFLDDLLLVLEKQEQYEKAPLVGKCLRAYMLKQIDMAEWRAMCHAIGAINVDALVQLREFYNHGTIKTSGPGFASDGFTAVGLLVTDSTQVGTWGGGGPVLRGTDLGKKFIEVIDAP